MRKPCAWSPEQKKHLRMSSTPALTPQERLAKSRKAIVRHMTRNDRDESSFSDASDASGFANQTSPHTPRDDGAWSAMAHAVQAWWQHHPVSVAFDFAKPVLGRYAAQQPFKLLGIAAAIGAAAVVLRPWRLVSVGGILLAAVKSAALPSVLLSMLSSSRPDASRHQVDREMP